MKVKDLIKELMQCDSDSDVVVDGEPIYFIEQLPGYYDGSYQRLIQDESKSPYYNIKGMEFTRSGSKVCLNVMSVEDIIWNAESEEELNQLVFEMDPSLSKNQKDRFEGKIEGIKEDLRKYFSKERKEK